MFYGSGKYGHTTKKQLEALEKLGLSFSVIQEFIPTRTCSNCFGVTTTFGSHFIYLRLLTVSLLF